MKNEQNLIKHLNKLVAFNTVAGNLVEQKKCLEYIKKQFAFYPFVINEYESNGHPSLVLTTEKTKHPEIFLSAHIDVVPGEKKLFKLQKKGGMILGRGVFDMKFAIATYICVLQEIYKQTKKLPSIGLMFTSEEEIRGNNGPGFLLKNKNYSCDLAFIPDGGEMWHIVKEAKGILELEIIISGKHAHASKPWQGESAIEKLFEAGKRIKKLYPSSSENHNVTVNFGKITGGGVMNQVADTASIFLDIRYAQGVVYKEIIKTLQSILPDAKILILDLIKPFSTDINNKYIKKWAKLIFSKNNEEIFIKENGASDASCFSDKKIPTIVSKPIGDGIHSSQEWMSFSSWVEFSEILKKFLLNN